MPTKLITIILLVFASIFANKASGQTLKLKTVEDNYPAALAKAKQENRLLFTVVYSLSCGLETLQEALSNDSVILFLNNNFTTLMIRNDYDTNKIFFEKFAEGTTNTGLYVIDPYTETLLHRYHGHFISDKNKTTILRAAKWALDSTLTYRYAMQRFLNGEDTITDKAFLLHFLHLVQGTVEIIPEYVDYYRKLINYKNPSYEDLYFIYNYCIYLDGEDQLYVFTPDTPEFELLFEKKDLFLRYFDSIQVMDRIKFIVPYDGIAADLIIENFDTVSLQKYLPYLEGGHLNGNSIHSSLGEFMVGTFGEGETKEDGKLLLSRK